MATATPAITALPTIPSGWAPSSSCVASTGFWYVVYATDVVFSDMFGMPSVTNTDVSGQGSSPTGNCVPPSYTLSVPYLTDGDCPSSYFPACSHATTYGTQSADYIMCCPSVSGWNFDCAPATDTGAAPYGCQASFSSGAKLTGSRTDLVQLTGQAETHTVGGDNGVNAWGIALLSTPSQTTSTSSSLPTSFASTTRPTITGTLDAVTATSSPSATSTAAVSTGLSSGASTGIGVGVGVGVSAVIAAVAFWFLRRRYKAKHATVAGGPGSPGYHDPHSGHYADTAATGAPTSQYGGGSSMGYPSPSPATAGGVGGVHGYYSPDNHEIKQPNVMPPSELQSYDLSRQAVPTELGAGTQPTYHEMPS